MPHALFQLSLHSQTGGFLEYDFSVEDGLWRRYSLAIESDFSDYGTNPDTSKINMLRFRVNGDISSVAEDGTIYIDAIGYTD